MTFVIRHSDLIRLSGFVIRACHPLPGLLAILLLPTIAAAQPARPNLLLILADDLGFSDVGCYGGEIRTPAIDSLAKQGVRFTQFYNMARCCPTRAALLTGLYPHQAGIGAMNQDLGKPAYQGELNDRCVTLAEILRDHGYHTAMTGKWHLTHLTIAGGHPRPKRLLNYEEDAPISPSTQNWPVNRGFEEHWGTIPGVNNFFDPYGLVHNESSIKPDRKDFYYTDFITQKSIEQIDRVAQDQKPFFLYVAYTAPHWPMHAREEDIARYKDTYQVGWDKIRQARLERQIAMGLRPKTATLSPRANNPRMNERESALGPWEEAAEKDWQARRMAVYAAMVESMDRGIAEILDKLKQKNLDQNTLVLFLSDNGACAENVQRGWYDIPTKTRDGRPIAIGTNPKVMPGPEESFQSYGPAWANASNTPFRRFKHYTEEGGISTPLIARWPAAIKQANHINHDQVGHVIDLVPTVLELTGAPYPKQRNGQQIPPPEGQSLVPALTRGEHVPRATPLFWEHEGNRAVRQGDWKLLAAHNESWQLYDVSTDRNETNNLADKHPEKVTELKSLYDRWAQRVGVEPWPVKRN